MPPGLNVSLGTYWRNTIFRAIHKNVRSITPLYQWLSDYFYRYITRRYPTVLTEIQTIDKIVDNNLSFARYGDGEFKLCRGQSIARQKANPDISQRLRTILNCDIPNFAVGVPPYPNKKNLVNRYEESYYNTFYYREWKAVHYMDCTKTYLSSFALRIYYLSHYPHISDEDETRARQKLQQIWENRDAVFVCSEQFDKNTVFQDLFGNAKSHSFIRVPNKQANDKYDDIIQTTQKYPVPTLFLLACGPTATILAYDLALKGHQAIDIGSCLWSPENKLE